MSGVMELSLPTLPGPLMNLQMMSLMNVLHSPRRVMDVGFQWTVQSQETLPVNMKGVSFDFEAFLKLCASLCKDSITHVIASLLLSSLDILKANEGGMTTW